ncbi:MAG TPA: hypothetical protein VI933_01730 [archaeon]|nr:hypothetical protein [archaeon]
MATREGRIVDAADKLIKLHPYDFKADYGYNNLKLGAGTYFETPVDRATRHKIAGTIAHRIKQYERANPDWREEMQRTGHVSPSESYCPLGLQVGEGSIVRKNRKLQMGRRRRGS